eukprot:scaffold7654_cov109-Isochrysis_galbana.AAC.4
MGGARHGGGERRRPPWLPCRSVQAKEMGCRAMNGEGVDASRRLFRRSVQASEVGRGSGVEGRRRARGAAGARSKAAAACLPNTVRCKNSCASARTTACGCGVRPIGVWPMASGGGRVAAAAAARRTWAGTGSATQGDWRSTCRWLAR